MVPSRSIAKPACLPSKPACLLAAPGLLLIVVLLAACGTTPSSATVPVASGAGNPPVSSDPGEAGGTPGETVCGDEATPLLDLDGAIGSMADQISGSATGGDRQRVAVLDFSSIREESDLFGRFLAEELIARLFLSERFDVVERRLLHRVIEEQELSRSDLVDEGSILELGRILGVDAILTGTCTDAGTEIRTNGRLIAIESGRICAVARARIEKDARIAALIADERDEMAAGSDMNRSTADSSSTTTPVKDPADLARGDTRGRRPGKPSRIGLGKSAGKQKRPPRTRGEAGAARPPADDVARVRELFLNRRIPESAKAAGDLLSDRDFRKKATASDLGWISFVLTEAAWELQGKGPAGKRNRYDEPMELALKAVKLDPGEAMAQCALGQVLHRTGRHREAIEKFEAALELDPQCRALPPQFRKSLQISGRAVNDRRPRPGN